MKHSAIHTALLLFLALAPSGTARIIRADPATYTQFLTSLTAGDTLALAAGRYTNNMTLKGISGTAEAPVVIMGSPALYSTVFQAQSCCNTVSITQCAYLVIKNLRLDGNNEQVDAVKGEGTNGNWAHHITLEYLDIVNYSNDQQIVGISTKCHAWNWTIRRNRIVGAGTGLYLGNSDGDKPFVGGLIEYNVVVNPTGYCMQIKHQNTGVRDVYPGTAATTRTIIRHNVFSKKENASTGANARPNVLLGAFPAGGAGADDVYEMYGNFVYENATEALLQATGNLALYNNVFVNHSDPVGYRAVYITAQNGFRPRNMSIFHNTVWTANSAGGIRLYNPDPVYTQFCHANAVFSPLPVSNFTDTLHNVVDTYGNAGLYLARPVTDITSLDLYPRGGALEGAETPSSPLIQFTHAGQDFNGKEYSWMYRGAYSGSGSNPGWKLQIDTMPNLSRGPVSVRPVPVVPEIMLYPQPAVTRMSITSAHSCMACEVVVYNVLGREMRRGVLSISPGEPATLDVRGYDPGVYILSLSGAQQQTRRFIVE